MVLAAFYLTVSVGYLLLAQVNPDAAQVSVPFVVVLLLAPALYGEWLRIKRGRK